MSNWKSDQAEAGVEDLERVGACDRCGAELFHSDSHPTHEKSNVGDYDFVCYPCQFEMMASGEWSAWLQERI